jgi:hypothetical protein
MRKILLLIVVFQLAIVLSGNSANYGPPGLNNIYIDEKPIEKIFPPVDQQLIDMNQRGLVSILDIERELEPQAQQSPAQAAGLRAAAAYGMQAEGDRGGDGDEVFRRVGLGPAL